MSAYQKRQKTIYKHAAKYSTAAVPPEKKYKDLVSGPVKVHSSTDMTGGEVNPATVKCISAMGHGDGSSEREGKHIKIQSVQVRGSIHWLSDNENLTPATLPPVMVAIVQDSQTNATQLRSQDVFTNPSGSIETNTVPFRNLNYGKRFKILKEFHFNPPTTAMGGRIGATDLMRQEGIVRTFEFYQKCDIDVNFTGGPGGLIGDVLDNSIHVIAMARQSIDVKPTSAPGTVFSPQITFQSRIRYIG